MRITNIHREANNGRTQSSKDPNNLARSLKSLDGPIGILKEAIRAVPAVKYALGVAGIAAAVSITTAFFKSTAAAFVGIVVMLLLMVLLVVFAAISSLARKELRYPALVFTWAVLILFVGSAVLLASSVFFDWPKPIDRLIRLEQNQKQEQKQERKAKQENKQEQGKKVTDFGAQPPDIAQTTLNASIDKYVTTLDIDTLLGQVLMVGVQAAEGWQTANIKLLETIHKYHLGGIVLYPGNFPPQSEISNDEEIAAQVMSLTNALQARAFREQPSGQRIPLLIGVDQEGGVKQALYKGATSMPSPMFIGSARSEDLARQAGSVIGSEMHSLGINTVFAPVADVNNNSTNDVIGMRAFGANPDLVAPLSVAFAQGLQKEKVLAVGKHFPGHGTSGDDPHFKLPELGYGDMAQLRQNDLRPFQSLIKAHVDGIMTAHILATPIDTEHPVTISQNAIHGILRGELKFNGLIFTDDLTSMMAILVDESGRMVRTRDEAAQQALEVGSDVLLFGQLWLREDPVRPRRTTTLEEMDRIYAHLRETFESKEGRPILERAAAHVLQAKARLFNWKPLDHQEIPVPADIGKYTQLLAKNRRIAEKIARESALLLSEDGQLINDLQQSKYFGPGRGPLSKNIILHSGDRITVVSPVFYPPDVFSDRLQRSWIGSTNIDVVHLIYGWRTEKSLKQAKAIWKEPTQRLSKNDIYGVPVYDRPAIRSKALQIISKSVGSRMIVFGVTHRDQAEVLKELLKELPAGTDKKIVVVVYIEPYFVPPELYRRPDTIVLSVSQYPDLVQAADLLVGSFQPHDISHLSFSIPGRVDRAAAFGQALARSLR